MSTSTQVWESSPFKKHMLLIILASVCAMFVGFALCAIYRVWKGTKKPSPDSVHLMEAPPLSSSYNIEHLKLIEIVGKIFLFSVVSVSINRYRELRMESPVLLCCADDTISQFSHLTFRANLCNS